MIHSKPFSLMLVTSVLLLGAQVAYCDAAAENLRQEWWKEAIVYQIYPRSFNDTDGDGVGDLKGITEKLDYIQSLGVDVVWLNPIYASPNHDNGYDISDYRAINPEFGTMADFDEMLSGMTQRGIKLMMDIVANHSSDEHYWFQQSRLSRENPYRDYYHWWPAERGKPAYRYSIFDADGDAWEYDETTDAYYLSYFSRKQPDLNWENEKVRREIYDLMKFWAEKGVGGFRLDAFQYVAKDTSFPPFPDGYEKDVIKYYSMGPRLHEYLRELNREVLSRYDVMAVAEGAGTSFQDAHDIVDAGRKELDMAYHFEGMDIGSSLDGYSVDEFRNLYSRWDDAFEERGWLAIFLANHDVPRMVSKFGDDRPEHRAASAKLLNTFILTMRGTPYCYFGDELGMTNIDFQQIDQYRDVAAINAYAKAKAEGQDMEHFMKTLNFLSRDNARTPMQWNAEPGAGFTSGEPWLAINQNSDLINVASQDANPESVLNHFRALTRLRKDNPALVYGDYELVLPEHEHIYAYTRTLDAERWLIVLNFSDRESRMNLPEGTHIAQVTVNNSQTFDSAGGRVSLSPYQAVVLRLD